MANANTALRKKLATVIATMTRTIGISTGPRSTLNSLPRRTCALRSAIATQIQIAGSSCTSVRRQFETSSLRPSNSRAKAPTANASGANTRRERLRRRTASSILASSLSSMARSSAPTRADRNDRRSLTLGRGTGRILTPMA